MEDFDRILVVSGEDQEIIGISYAGNLLQAACTQRTIFIAFARPATFVDLLFILVLGWEILPLACNPPIQFIEHNIGEQR